MIDDENKDLEEEENKEDEETLDEKEDGEEDITEIIDDIKSQVDDIISSGGNTDDSARLIDISRLFNKKMNNLKILIGIILFPISFALILALTGLIEWIQYKNIYVVLGAFLSIAFLDTLLCTLAKIFLYKIYMFSFGSFRQAVLLVLILCLYFLSGILDLTISSFLSMLIVFELYALIKGIIGILIDYLVLTKNKNKR